MPMELSGKLSLEEYFPQPDHLYYFWKGRVALYTLLKTLGIGPGDEVILPGFTCVVVANAVLYLNGSPVYADIDPKTYNITSNTIEPLITKRTKAILAQSTFGLSPDMDPILALADRHQIPVIEDCAQGLGSLYKGKPAGTSGTAAFFSTQWSKPVSTGLGGIAYVGNPDLAEKVGEVHRNFPCPSIWEEGMLAAQLLLRPLMNVPFLYYGLLDTYRYLTQRMGISVGSSTGEELVSPEMPEGYLKKMGFIQRKRWNRGFSHLQRNIERRRSAAARYDEFFQELEINPPARPDYAYHSMLRYVVRVKDKSGILQKANRYRIPIGDWFVSPLDPIEGDLSPWKYLSGQCPIAEKASQEVINLFTDQVLSREQLEVLFL